MAFDKIHDGCMVDTKIGQISFAIFKTPLTKNEVTTKSRIKYGTFFLLFKNKTRKSYLTEIMHYA